MNTPSVTDRRVEGDSNEENQPLTPLPFQLGHAKAHEKATRLKISNTLLTPSLQKVTPLTPRSIPSKLCRRQHFPSSPLSPVNSSPCPFNLLHASSINGDKAGLQYALSEGGLRWLESRDKFGRTALVYACLGDRPECVAILLSAGASPVSVDDFGRNAFHWAAIKGLYGCYKIMFKHEKKSLALYSSKHTIKDEYIGWKMKDKSGATPFHLSTCANSTKCFSYILKNAFASDIDCEDNKKRTPLHWAAAAGNAEVIRMLLKAKAKVDVLDENGKPPLFHAACSFGKKPGLCIKLLLEKSPATITWKDNEGRSALHLAVADQSNVEVINLFLSHCKNWKEMKDASERTPLHWAAILGRMFSAKFLLSTFAESSSLSDVYGATPLHYAAMSNNPDMIRQIVDLDQKVINVGDHEGRTSLTWAANTDSCEAIQELVKLGADLEHCDKTGQTALHAASIKGSLSAVKLLAELKSKVDVKDEVGNTPLAAACEFGHYNVFIYLKDHGADIETTNLYLRKLSHLAVAGGHSFILYTLVKMGCELNCKDVLGLTPLHLACKEGSIDCTSILVEKDANCYIQDNDGCTPLHYAVAGCHEEVVQMLLDHSANVNILSSNGKTALDICIESGHKMLADKLSSYGAVSSTDLLVT